jgi:type II secretory pathway pseudopilin PulG
MNMKNQSGYTLITTLLIATLIVTVSFVLIGMALNTNKQIQLSEQDMQATDLAEMGLTYFQEKVNKIVTNYTNANDIASEVNKLNNKIVTVQSTSPEMKQFKITLDSSLSKDNLSTQVSFYGCVGNCDDPTSKKETIRSIVQLVLKEGGETGSTVVISHGNQDVEVESCSKLANNNKIVENCYFKDQADLDDYLLNQKKNELAIHKATVYFLGDVTIENLKFEGNSNSLCVYGKLDVLTDTSNGNAIIYAHKVSGSFHKKTTIIQGEDQVTTNCGTYSFNGGHWSSTITNIQYE